MMEKLSEIEREFDIRFKKLLEALSMHCQMVDECVFLLFRLDFNEYYARKHAVREAVPFGDEAGDGDASAEQVGGARE